MRAIFITIFLPIFLFLISCKPEESGAIESEQTDSIVPNEPIEENMIINLNQETSDDSIHVILNVQKINESEFNFQIEMQLFGESWVLSPLEKEFPYGCMEIEFDQNEKLELIDPISENPESKYLNDSNWQKPYRVISDEVVLEQKLKINSKEDFTLEGYIFFVLEPICNPYRMEFALFYESGNLRVEETSMHIAK